MDGFLRALATLDCLNQQRRSDIWNSTSKCTRTHTAHGYACTETLNTLRQLVNTALAVEIGVGVRVWRDATQPLIRPLLLATCEAEDGVPPNASFSLEEMIWLLEDARVSYVNCKQPYSC